MDGMLKDRVVLVTGSGSGIGQTTAVELAREGAIVAVCDLNEEGGAETVRRIEEIGGQGTFRKADVTNSEEVKGLIRGIVDRWGRLDGALNNAGVGQDKAPVHETDESVWRRVIEINLTGVFICMKHEITQMLAQGNGSIVNISSINGLAGWREEGAYVASKHGVLGITRSAALENAPRGVRINAVCPGVVLTPMSQYQGNDPEVIKKLYPIPMERRARMEEISQAVIWLLSDRSSYTTGHALVADGGFMAG